MSEASASDIYICEVSARETYTVRVRAASQAEAKRKARAFNAAWDESPEAVYNWGTRVAVRVHSAAVDDDV